jgi:hypothetical protein
MCQDKERDTSNEHEEDKNFFLHKNSERKEDDYGNAFTL